MSKLKSIRESRNLTQEELSEKSGVSVRTIQRIESGNEPKGYTLRVLAKALAIEEKELLTQEVQEENKGAEEEVFVSYSSLKLINLSSILFVVIPPLNILVPLILMVIMKPPKSLAKQIISVQILWTIIAPIVFMSGVFLKLGRQFTLVIMILIVLSNVFIILRNAVEIDRNQRLYYKLNFSLL